jgi:hypothetical protein
MRKLYLKDGNIMAKKSAESKHKNIPLEERNDLMKTWFIRNWFNEDNIDEVYLKKIFLELFMSLYDDLTEKFEAKKRDELFLKFINDVFTTALDNYKWYESEKMKKDIGIAKALEDIAMCDWYINLLTTFSRHYDKK